MNLEVEVLLPVKNGVKFMQLAPLNTKR
jgi:hypothetical protein